MYSNIPHTPKTGHRRRARLILFCLLLGPAAASAGTLGEAIDSALDLEGQRARVGALRDERDAMHRQAASLVASDPGLRMKHLSDRLTTDEGAYDWEAVVELPLWMPGQRTARQAVAAALDERAATLDLFLRWEMAGRVRETVWNARLAQGRVDQAAQALANARALASTVDKRLAAGDLARVDALVAHQAVLDREAEYQAARMEAEEALARYRHLTGQAALPDDSEEAVSAADRLPPDQLSPEHPLMAEADSAVGVARRQRDQARSERTGHPLLSLGTTVIRDARGADQTTALQIELSIPFGLASQAAPTIAAAERIYTEQASERQRLLRQAEADLIAARLSRRGAGEALAIAEQRQRAAHEAFTLVRRAFELGEADLTTLLRAEDSAREASVALELRRLEQGRARARLNQALGVIPQ
ncbi:TolC family protein [Allochromatium palmeri]|uniref:TolC family protein n=1 Tax=Allochromatium palmeri TaxID=231048 RepID=A0A6N8E8C0_9GAMM|nr:TolC family protein [Allochromatium palmeri]MTW20523.1 TolC family protein [Allochromatium palmeri]